jgi:uncharacterized protein YbjT (DUF2867 family)
MKIVIFGATGRTGRHLVDQALALGHEVLAFARDPSAITTRNERLRVATGDVLDPEAVETALAGQKAVICALGPRGTKPGTLASAGTSHIIRAMERHGVRRLVCQSAVGVGDSKGQGGPILNWIVLPFFLKHVYADKERQEAAIRDSTLDWIIVRPQRLLDQPATGKWRVSLDGSPVGRGIARADVAAFILAQLEDDRYLRKTPVIGS